MANDAVLTQAVPFFLEVLPPNASKGHGVTIALNHLRNLNPNKPMKVVAVGDGENDISMFHAVQEFNGKRLAVANAKAALKAIADEIVPSNDEHGVVFAIQRLLSL